MKLIRNRILIVATIFALLFNYSVPFAQIVSAEGTNAVAAEDGNFTLTVMHTNDTHARVEQFPYLGTVVEQVRSENPNNLLLHAGDVFSGTLYFNVHEGLADLYFLNEIGFDAMTFGNHEFDKDSQVLANFVDGAQFPFVSANIDFTKDSILGDYALTEIGKPGTNGKIQPAIIKEVGGELVGIIGLTTEDTPNIASPSADIGFEDAVKETDETIELLEEEGINKIIVLSHLGYEEDVALANAVAGIDVIVGGHSHTVLTEGKLIKNENDEPTVIVQTGEYLNNLGQLDVTFDEQGVVSEFEAQLIELDDEKVEADPALQTKVIDYKAPIEILLQEVVGETTVPLDGERADVRTGETNLGNLIADGMVWKLQEYIPEVTIAMQNGGGIRASIDAGEITMGEVRTVLPFDNALVAIELTGQEILEALEHSVSAYPEQNGGFLHVSGLKFRFDSELPAGERVWSVEVKTQEGSYEGLDLDQHYTVATNSFTAKGGDGYESLERAYLDGRMTNIDVPDYEVFSEYIRAHTPVKPKVERRIVNQVEPAFSLAVMHTNDSHARVEQFPLLGTAVNEIRLEYANNLLLHAGDVFSGTLYFTVHKGLADLYFLNTLHYDAMTFGNHEFDKGSEVLQNFVKDAQFPFVSSNIDFTKDSFLSSHSVPEIGQPGDGGKIYPAIIKNINGELVGIFGLTTEETPSIASPSDETVFEDAVEESIEAITLLKAQGVNKIIALSHLGYEEDLELAEVVDGIDVIVGGHTHTALPEGDIVEKEEPTVVVQTGGNLENLGFLDIGFDENGKVISYFAELLDLEDYEAAPELQAKVDVYYEDIEELLLEVVGETTVALDGEREDVRTRETNLGNLIADGMVWKLQQFIPEVTIAMQNGGGIRASIDAGEITMGEVRTVLPFDNALVAIKLTGDEILQALEHSVRAYPEQNGGFLHVSGLKFKFDPEKPAGERVWSVEVKTTEGTYVPLEGDAYYTVATNSFTAQGGDGFDSLKQAYEDGRMTNIDVPDYEVFSDYLAEFSPVSPEVEGRIVAAKENEAPVEDGKELPDTATNSANLLVFGLILMVFAAITFAYNRKSVKNQTR